MIEISIIIVNYNSEQYLPKLLRTIRENIDLYYEVIIIDNHSSSPIKNPNNYNVSIINNNTNMGYGKAINKAFIKSKGEYILILNPDTEIVSGKINDLIKITHDTNAIIGCKQIDSNDNIEHSTHSFPSIKLLFYELLFLPKIFGKSSTFSKYSNSFQNHDVIFKPDAVRGSFLFLKRSLFQELNGFDEDYFLYTEEIDLCYRHRSRNGIVIYFPEFIVKHHKGKSRPNHLFELKNIFISQSMFIKKHHSLTYWVIFVLILCIVRIEKSLIYLTLYLLTVNSEYKIKASSFIKSIPKNPFGFKYLIPLLVLCYLM